MYLQNKYVIKILILRLRIIHGYREFAIYSLC